MIINNIHSNTFYKGLKRCQSISKHLNVQHDDLSKSLLKQIDNFKKQIEKINENNGLSQKEKINQIKNLNEQIEELNKQINEIKIHEQKQQNSKKTNMNNKNNVYDSNDTSKNMDIFLDANTALYKMKNIGKIKSSLKSTSRILKSEAKLDASRDKTGNAVKIIKGKLSKASKLESYINNIEVEISKECNTIHNKLQERFLKGEKFKNIEKYIEIYNKYLIQDKNNLIDCNR